MKVVNLGAYTKIKTGKLDANASSPDGRYPFFTCAIAPIRIATFSYDCECVLVAGNGDLNVKYYDGKFDAYQRTYIIESVDKKKLDVRYTYHFLSRYVEKLRSLSIGGVIKYIKLGNLTEAQIPLPPLAEQKRIAVILDKADAIRRKRQQALNLTETFLRSTFLHMFGDPVTNPMGWEVRNSIDLFSEKPRIGTTTPAKGKGYLVVRVGELGAQSIAIEKCNRVELSDTDFNKFNLHQGDTIIARAIGSKKQLGKSSYFDSHEEPIVIDSHVMRLRPDQSVCDPFWFYNLLSLPEGIAILQKAGGETAVQFNINATQASSMQIPLPPRELQSQFTSIARKLTQSRDHQITSSISAKTLFSSLQQQAFQGEL